MTRKRLRGVTEHVEFLRGQSDPLAGGILGRLRRHPVMLAVVALAIAAGTAVAIAASAGFARVGDVFASIRPGWIALAAAGQVVGVLAYAFSYRIVAAVDAGPRLRYVSALNLVAAGFGAFTAAGGFTLDYHAWRLAGHGKSGARIRVLGLGAVEYAVLAPAACIAAIALLAGGSGVMPSLLWPWALAVPAGFAAAFWAVAKREWLTKGGERQRLDDLLRAVGVLRRLFTSPLVGVEAGAAMAIYWAAELASLWASLMAFGASISLPALIVAYATGYAATRRTLPLGGAGTTEALLTYSLHWVGVGRAHALAAVVVYRVFNFGLTTLPALQARKRIEPLFRDGARGDDSACEAIDRLVA